MQKVLKQCKRLTVLFVANGCLNKKGFFVWHLVKACHLIESFENSYLEVSFV